MIRIRPITGWSFAANRKPMPFSTIDASTFSAGASRFTPSSANTSAEPQRLVAARLPCLAIATPAPAATKQLVVEMLKVFEPSPPVPTTSTTSRWPQSMKLAARRITAAAPESSPPDTP